VSFYFRCGGCLKGVVANERGSIQFNIVSKKLGCDRMSFYLAEAANDVRDLLLPTLETPKPKL
jgi:hypothetical protein